LQCIHARLIGVPWTLWSLFSVAGRFAGNSDGRRWYDEFHGKNMSGKKIRKDDGLFFAQIFLPG
jgi:hypothetical protein